MDKLIWDDSLEKERYDSVDDKLIQIAKNRNGILVTNDVYLKVKAITKGIKTKAYGKTEAYNGIKEMLIDPNDEAQYGMINQIANTGEIPEEFGLICENQYILFKDINQPITNKHGETDYAIYDIFVCHEGILKHISQDHELRINNKWCVDPKKGIGPRNPEQKCLFDILYNKDISIVYAGGKFGTGKSFIINNYALQELEKGNIKKIVYVPNNAYTENTIDIGALPGELLDKVAGQIGPLIDLTSLDAVQDMIIHD
jgi:predicted ribonuclease YlaK